MTKRRDTRGRRKGSRNKGYFFRAGRGWFTKVGATFIPLTTECGERLRDKETPAAVLADAYARFRLTQKVPKETVGEGVLLEQVCAYYLDRAERESRSSTVEKRADTLYDLCFGFPAKFRRKGKPTAADRIHPGYGQMLVVNLRPFHLEQWIEAHKKDAERGLKGWTSDTGRRTRLQAVKRALNRSAKGGLIPKDHPIRGMFVPRGRARVTYLDDQQEAALLNAACPALRDALKVLIRTGMRPGCELAKLTAAHVRDNRDRMELHFDSEESKNNRERIVMIREPWLLEDIRSRVKQYPTGPLYRNSDGKEWLVNSMSRAFRRALDRAKAAGQKFDDDTCLYACRHTFAKRALTGHWTGKPINMELLAGLMGNTPAVCAQHYADILKKLSSHRELLWSAC